jgi:hypothetical protein
MAVFAIDRPVRWRLLPNFPRWHVPHEIQPSCILPLFENLPDDVAVRFLGLVVIQALSKHSGGPFTMGGLKISFPLW